MNCAACGNALKIGKKFCAHCGAPVSEPPAKVAPNVCPQCGTENVPGAKFCRTDGTRLVQVAARELPPEQNVGTIAETPVAAPADLTPDDEVESVPDTPVAPVRKPPPPSAPLRESRRPEPAAPDPVPQPPKLVVTESPASSGLQQPPQEVGSTTEPVRPSRNFSVLIISSIATFLIVGGVGGYLYWAGIVGNRQGSVAQSLTGSLLAQGYGSVTVSVDKQWIATVQGAVVGQDKHDQVLKLVAAAANIKGVNDQLEVRASATELQNQIAALLAQRRVRNVAAQVDDAYRVHLSGTADSAAAKANAEALVRSVPGVSEVDNQIGESLVWKQDSLNALLAGNGLAAVRGTFRGDQLIQLNGSVDDDDQRTLAENLAHQGFPDAQVQNAVSVRPPVAEQPVAQEPVPVRGRSVVAAPAAPVSREPPLRGLWIGKARAGLLSYTVNINIGSLGIGQIAGTTLYSAGSSSSVLCGGEVKLLELTADSAVFEERMTRFALICPAGGTISVSLQNSTAVFEWHSKRSPGRVTMKADLQRR